MIDDLIPYFQRELEFFQDSADAFAKRHPGVAEQLKIRRGKIEDPHVERLIQGVAFLNARLRHKIDEDFWQISDALLDTLYPHLIAPLPSFFIARLAPGPDLVKPLDIARGTFIDAWIDDDRACRFRLAHDARVLPARISAASVRGDAYPRPANAPAATRGVLHMQISAIASEFDFGKAGLDRLGFYLRGDARKMQILIEQFGVNLLGIGVALGSGDPDAVNLEPGALRNLGFDPERLLLPQRDASLRAYAIVQEYFAYPEKHRFFELTGIDRRTQASTGGTFDLYFYFDRVSSELEKGISAADFELNAVPVINLFEPDPCPFDIDQTTVEYRVSPGAEREHEVEVYCVTDLEIQRGGETIATAPLHAVRHAGDEKALFYATRRATSFGPGGGDDVYLAVADRAGQLLSGEKAIAVPALLVFDRNVPDDLPWHRIEPVEMINNLSIEGLTAATPPRRPGRQREAKWKLVSQLSLNHLGLSGSTQVAEALCEILELYDTAEKGGHSTLAERLVSASANADVARAKVAGHMVLCSGTTIELVLQDERLSGSGSYLLCEVIERFLATAASLNSFIRLRVRLRHEHPSTVWKEWPPHVGDRELL